MDATTDTLEDLRRIIGELFDDTVTPEQITPETKIAEVCADDFDLGELRDALISSFGIPLSDAQFEACTTIEDIISVIES